MYCKPREKGFKRNAQPEWRGACQEGKLASLSKWDFWQADARGSNLS